jgi:Asp-tRNA(Asn)/Glu-tRNA(Gln) amidotransferase A subunit family amidase
LALTFRQVRHFIATAETGRVSAAAAGLNVTQSAVTASGILFTVKDIVNTKDVRTTFGAIPYRDNVPDHDAVAVARLRAAARSSWARLRRRNGDAR